MSSARCVGNPYLGENVCSQISISLPKCERFNPSSLQVGNALEHSAFACWEHKKKRIYQVIFDIENIAMIFTTKLAGKKPFRILNIKYFVIIGGERNIKLNVSLLSVSAQKMKFWFINYGLKIHENSKKLIILGVGDFTWIWSEVKIFLSSGGDLTRNAWDLTRNASYTYTVYVNILKVCIYI